MLISRSTGSCSPVKTNFPSAFLHNLFATNIALNPDESQYLQFDKSIIIFFSPFPETKTSSDF